MERSADPGHTSGVCVEIVFAEFSLSAEFVQCKFMERQRLEGPKFRHHELLYEPREKAVGRVSGSDVSSPRWIVRDLPHET